MTIPSLWGSYGTTMKCWLMERGKERVRMKVLRSNPTQGIWRGKKIRDWRNESKVGRINKTHVDGGWKICQERERDAINLQVEVLYRAKNGLWKVLEENFLDSHVDLTLRELLGIGKARIPWYHHRSRQTETTTIGWRGKADKGEIQHHIYDETGIRRGRGDIG